MEDIVVAIFGNYNVPHKLKQLLTQRSGNMFMKQMYVCRYV